MRIFLFRGLMGRVFSTGMERLAEKLKKEGHNATTHAWYSRRSVRKQAFAHMGPIGLVGHSLGGNAANRAANHLQKKGSNIVGLVCIDPTSTRPVHNIEGYCFRSRDVRDEDVPGLPTIHRDDLTHTQIDKDARVHKKIIDLFDVKEG